MAYSSYRGSANLQPVRLNPLAALRGFFDALRLARIALCDLSINTVTRLLVDAGTVCAAFHDMNVRGVKV
jgi:hypothetical protein